MRQRMFAAIACLLLIDVMPVARSAGAPVLSVQTDGLATVLAGDWRTVENRARDRYRHPAETLAWFGVGPGQTVIEISPGAGWYTEVLAPMQRGSGRYIGALVEPASARNDRARDYYASQNQALRDKLAARSDIYGEAVLLEYSLTTPVLGAPGSADAVLTFRNVHNWVMAGSEAAMFQAFFDVLKPGGVLGVVEHRAAPGRTVDQVKQSGYLPQDYVIALAKAAGFELQASSEINANPADSRDHANGVWTLPPVLRVPEGEEVSRYQAIGESDRMTLRLVKPAVLQD